MYCKNCNFRDIDGNCQNPNIQENFNFSDKAKDNMLVHSYTEGGSFYVGPHFGCIHFKPINLAENLGTSRHES